nr:unnamed protein product [Callosobruchus chinensis]
MVLNGSASTPGSLMVGNGMTVRTDNGNGRTDWDKVIVVEQMTPDTTKKTAAEVVDKARRAYMNGKSKNLKFREMQLKGLLNFLVHCKSKIEAALYKDLRKHRQESSSCEIELVANDCRHTIMDFKKWAKPENPDKRLVNLLDGVHIYNDPYGVVLIIGAWNYPILLTLGPLVGALAAGNVVILKPSELAPATAELLANTLTKFLDPECFQVILGGIEDTTELLREKFDYIFFTGSTTVGKIVHQAAAKHLTPTTLELGGKSPVYIHESADMEKTAKRVIWGRNLNSGQTCISPDYILCSKEVQERFLQQAKKVMLEFYGSEPKKSPYISRIVTERHFKRLLEFIKPDKVAIGGKFDAAERVISPTILINVSPNDPVMCEEIFGPILPIINIKSPEEAVDFINARDKPLALYVFTKEKTIREMFLKNTSSGGITINDTITHIITENLPFGGVGSSGMGAYHGKRGFDTFTHKKAVLIKDFAPYTELALSLRYPPYSDTKTDLMNFLLKKRKGIPMKHFKILFIFILGVLSAVAFQYIQKTIVDKEHK